MKLFDTKPNLSEVELKKGLRMYIIDGITTMGVASLQGGVYLVAFALAMGASQMQIGIIASIAFLSQLMQLPGLMLVNRYPRRKLITIVAVTLSRLFWIFIILLPFFTQTNVTVLLILLLASALISSIQGPAWNSLLRDLLPTERLGNINSKRLIISTALAIVLTLAGGYFVDWWEVTYPQDKILAYSILFGGGLLFGIWGIIAILRIPEPVNTARKLPIMELLRSPVKDHNFRMLIIFLAVWNLAVNMSAPFFIVYMFNRLGLSLFMITILIVVGQLITIISLNLWGRLADRFSNKTVLLVSGPLFLITMIMWTFTSMPNPHKFTLPLLFAIHILNGMAVAGVSIGTANIALKLSPQGQAHNYMTAVGLSSSVMGAIAPIAGGILAGYFANVQLHLPLELTINASKYSLPILNITGLDFLFIITFLIGIFAIHRLAFVKEEGEVGRRLVIDEITDSIVMPIKSLSVLSGVGRLAILPISGMMHIAAKVVPIRKKRGETEKVDFYISTINKITFL